MPRFTVIVSYPNLRKRKIDGVIDYINEELQSFNNRTDATNYCHKQLVKGKHDDYFYVIDNEFVNEDESKEPKTIFYLKV